jgi:TonB-linked SusC/RagA family outer membrane protein
MYLKFPQNLLRLNVGRVVLLFLHIMLFAQPVLAQTKVITGTVNDESGAPLSGASVVVANNNKLATATDAAGKFRIAVETLPVTLIISYTGYESASIRVDNAADIKVTLSPSTKSMGEVVVTALGIKRSEKSLSYATQKISGDQLIKAKNPNLGGGLQGKIAGLTVNNRSGAPGESPAITIRGSRSITGNNEPLYVVDGFPISGRIVDINPNDIESISVLKGATAAALYGLRASNGVIVITTKRGASGTANKPTITVDQNFTYEDLTRFPKLQTTYGQGEGGRFVNNSTFSWGPRIDTMGTYINQLGEPEQAAVYDNPGNFFVNGKTYNLNIDVSNKFDRGNYSVGLGYVNQKGTIPTAEFERLNFKAASDYNLSGKVKIGSSITFSHTKDSRVVDGSGNSSLFYAAFFAPVTYDLKNKPIARPDDPYNQINFRGGHDNIYWSIKNNSNIGTVLRTIGNTYIEYKPLSWLTFQSRAGVDYSVNNRKTVLSLGSGATGGRTNPPSGGQIVDFGQTQQQFNIVSTLTANKSLTKDIGMNLVLGNEFLDTYSRSLTITGNSIVIGGFNHISNTSVQIPNENVSRGRLVGFFANGEFSYKNYLFLNASIRNDVVSNMPVDNNSFLYPSIGAGFVFTDAFNISSDILSYGKVRASFAEVGQAGPLFVSQNVYVRGNIVDAFGAGNFQFPFSGLTAFTIDRNLVSNIRPENIRTTEFGFDLRFFKNRVGIDYTYYSTLSAGQIFRVPLAFSTGFSTELRNSGSMSVKGHEVVLNTTPVKTAKVTWDFITNFTTFDNRVVELAEGIQRLTLGGFRAQIIAERGKPYPSLIGSAFARDANNNIVVDSRQTLPNGNPNPAYGMPLRSLEQNKFLGKVNPDFEFNFINNVRYNQFSLGIQFDWRQGGFISSGLNRLGKLYGMLYETSNRENTQVFPGSKGFYDANGNLVVLGPNDIPIVKGEYFYRTVMDPIIESNVYSATFVRLRELRIAYDFKPKFLERFKMRGASFYLVGRNLWLRSALPNVDPEMDSGSGNVRGEEYLVVPQTANYGIGLNIIF